MPAAMRLALVFSCSDEPSERFPPSSFDAPRFRAPNAACSQRRRTGRGDIVDVGASTEAFGHGAPGNEEEGEDRPVISDRIGRPSMRRPAGE